MNRRQALGVVAAAMVAPFLPRRFATGGFVEMPPLDVQPMGYPVPRPGFEADLRARIHAAIAAGMVAAFVDSIALKSEFDAVLLEPSATDPQLGLASRPKLHNRRKRRHRR